MRRRPLIGFSQARRITAAFRDFSKRTNTMYMGAVDQRQSEYHLVRGFTASHHHNDTDHCIGTYLHHDFIVLHRETRPGRALIVEVDLHTIHAFEHLFVIPNSIERRWFDTILKLYPRLRHAPFAQHDPFSPRFKDTYSILSLPTHFGAALDLVANEVEKSIMSLQNTRYVYEVFERSLFVYDLEDSEPTTHSLDVQVRFACALASALELTKK